MEIVAMKGEVKRQSSFFAEPIYAVVVPKDHLLRRLLEMVDWGGLAERVADCYADEGRPSWPPEQMIKIVVLQYLYDRSDRQMEEDLRYHLAFKFFVGLAADEVGPDNATICRFRSRLGEERPAVGGIQRGRGDGARQQAGGGSPTRGGRHGCGGEGQ